MTTHTDTHTIDASGKKLGRVASSIASILLGKNRTDASKQVVAAVAVKVVNAKKLAIDERKMRTKEYQQYSGYPGGLRKRSMAKVIEGKGYAEVLRKAVYGMLPNNRLRARRMKALTIEE